MASNYQYDSGERVYVGHSSSVDNEALHVERYRFAARFIGPSMRVLDAACGSGYGTEMLSQNARSVIGLEISDHALAYARQHHARANVEFALADLSECIPFQSEVLDAVVSFETVEHIANADHLVEEFARILKPAGLLVLSTPDRNVYSEILGGANPFHVHELTKSELIGTLSKSFRVEGLYGQLLVSSRVGSLLSRVLIGADKFGWRHKRFASNGVLGLIRRHLRPTGATTGSNIVLTGDDSRERFVYLVAIARKL